MPKKVMQIHLECPNCGASIRAEDVNIDKLIAKCSQCHTLFGFDTMLKQVERHRPEVPLPPGVDAMSYLSELNIEIIWRKTSNAGFFIFFTIFWNAILIPFIIIALTQGEWIILLFISLHLLVGLSLLYYTLSILFNTTYIRVNHQELNIQHRPFKMPFYPDRHEMVSDIDQLFIDKYVESRTNNQPNFAYAVRAVLKSNPDKRVRIIRGLKNQEQARYVEQEVERFLNIKDRPVEGEWVS
ncbi:MAG: hypothetical protein SFU99_22245 [Saprospiraceae bacterium]|nr:hypothetical protein [Saprospiraceae bacterium]